VYALLTGLVL